jgi:hypothetical protein
VSGLFGFDALVTLPGIPAQKQPPPSVGSGSIVEYRRHCAQGELQEMNQIKSSPHAFAGPAVLAAILLLARLTPAQAAKSSEGNADKPYVVEWVYKVKWGHADEYWQLFKKYQIAILNREKELGYVTSYTVYRPGLHTGEDTRWEFTVLITYKSQADAGHAREITKRLFPDQDAMKRDENRRWELVEAHWDLPIRAIDPGGDGEE